ncbi:MAG: hypothetical protein R2747_21465 [Pyrinomonadaceae bacterium]
MKFFEGKSPKEKNQIIILMVVGTLAVLAVGYNLSGLFWGKSKGSSSAKKSPTPTATVRTASQNPNMPTQTEMDFQYGTTKVIYVPNSFNAPGPGRNIFAFYEPPKPTPYSPTPTPTPKPPTPPPPTPTPDYLLAYAAPGSVYAGSAGFTLELNGDRFTPEVGILFNGNQLPTTYIGPQRLRAEIPANAIAFAGTRNISVFSADGRYSNMITINVQEPPKPQVEYIGMIARKRYNNDTAYFTERGKDEPIGARLNDIVGGRFRLKSISAQEVVFEDVNLGFVHKLKLKRPEPGQASSFPGNPRGGGGNYTPYTPPVSTEVPSGNIPGIPANIPRYRGTPRATPKPDNDKDDDDGDDDDGDNR